MDSALTDDMFFFRKGGDEFGVVTGYTDIEDTKRYEQSVISQNDQIVNVNGITANAYLHSGIMLYSDVLDEDAFHDKFYKTIVRN